MGIWTIELKLDGDEAMLVRECLARRAQHYADMADAKECYGVLPETQRRWENNAKALRAIVERLDGNRDPYTGKF